MKFEHLIGIILAILVVLSVVLSGFYIANFPYEKVQNFCNQTGWEGTYDVYNHTVDCTCQRPGTTCQPVLFPLIITVAAVILAIIAILTYVKKRFENAR